MNDIRYMISEAANLVGVEQHTLRYWEDEIELDIQRNELGHRYYRDEDIKLLRIIKQLKDKGYQLRAIRMLIPEIQERNLSSSEDIEKLQKTCDTNNVNYIRQEDILMPVEVSSSASKKEVYNNNVNGDQTIEKLEQFKIIMKDLIMDVLKENNENLSAEINEELTNSIIKEMDYLLRIKEEREKERYRKLDKTIRQVQNAREEAASSKIFGRKNKNKFFK